MPTQLLCQLLLQSGDESLLVVALLVVGGRLQRELKDLLRAGLAGAAPLELGNHLLGLLQLLERLRLEWLLWLRLLTRADEIGQ